MFYTVNAHLDMPRMAVSAGRSPTASTLGKTTTAAGATAENRMTSAMTATKPIRTMGSARTSDLVVVDVFQGYIIKRSEATGEVCDRNQDKMPIVAVSLTREAIERAVKFGCR